MNVLVRLHFNSGKVIEITPFDTELNRKALAQFNLKDKKFNSYFFEKESVFVGFDSHTREWSHGDVDFNVLRKNNLERIREGFRSTNLKPHSSLFNGELTIKDCAEIHRIFTSAFLEMQSSGILNPTLHSNLQKINHGVHDYESTLDTPNCKKFFKNEEYRAPVNAGGAFWEDMSSNIYQVTEDYDRSELSPLYDIADVFYYDDCRIGRNFKTAWYMDDDPTASDILDVDSIAPIFKIGNEINDALYKTDEFHDWLKKWNYDYNKPYKDIPFGKITSTTTHHDIDFDDSVINMEYIEL